MTYSKKTRLVERSPIDSGSKLFLSLEVKTQGVQVEACRQEFIFLQHIILFLFYPLKNMGLDYRAPK